MFLLRAIREGDLIEIKYRGVVYAGPVRYSGCSKLPGRPGYDLDTLEFTNASTGDPHNWKPDIDEGAVLRRVTYNTPICPTCNVRRHTFEIDNQTSYWQCANCGYQGIADVFILEDTFYDKVVDEWIEETAAGELTDAQVDRQDLVDDLIYNLICELNPGETDEIEWDIEVIAEVRDVLCDYFTGKGLTTEMEFYPYVELEFEGEPVDDMPALEALALVLDIAREHVISDPNERQERAIEALEKLL